MRRLLLAVLGAAVFVAALVLGWNFGAANERLVEIDLLWIQLAEVSVWQLVVASFGLGAGLVALGSGFLGVRGWVLKRRYRKTIRRLESELHQLRSLPLAADAETAARSELTPIAEGQGG